MQTTHALYESHGCALFPNSLCVLNTRVLMQLTGFLDFCLRFTKAPFNNFSALYIFDFAGLPLRFFEYLTGAITDKLRRHMSNMNVWWLIDKQCFDDSIKRKNNGREEVDLTLNVRGPSYLGLTMSLSWLLMPWLLTSPGHQHPCYWIYRIGKSYSYLRKDSNYLCHINVE